MKYWIESANKDYETMKVLHKNKKNTWCLFMGDLVIEKLLKAIYAKNNKVTPYAPRTHELTYLADRAGLDLSAEQRVILDKITNFNLDARYDDYKNNFYNICNDEYTEQELLKIEEVIKWLKQELSKTQK